MIEHLGNFADNVLAILQKNRLLPHLRPNLNQEVGDYSWT
jgi:hypothetical protein